MVKLKCAAGGQIHSPSRLWKGSAVQNMGIEAQNCIDI